MIIGSIIGIILSLVLLILYEDPSISGWVLITIAYYTTGLCIALYKFQKVLPAKDYKKILTDFAKMADANNIEIRAELLKHLKYMQDLNNLVGLVDKDNKQLKSSILEITEALDLLVNSSEDFDDIEITNRKDLDSDEEL